jgi:uncharacterized protein YjiS (DUF1127 family)
MSTFNTATIAASKSAAGIFSIAGAVAAKAAALWAAWNAWRAIRRDQERLAAMDDRMLKDIGLTRHEVTHAVRFGRHGD